MRKREGRLTVALLFRHPSTVAGLTPGVSTAFDSAGLSDLGSRNLNQITGSINNMAINGT